MKLTALIIAVALKFGIDPELFTALIAQESSFRSIKSCYIVHRNRACEVTCDWGLAQVNDVWIKRWNLDPQRLLEDPRYNLETGARILQLLKRQYQEEDNFWSRYNTAHAIRRAKYEQQVLGRLQ